MCAYYEVCGFEILIIYYIYTYIYLKGNNQHIINKCIEDYLPDRQTS